MKVINLSNYRKLNGAILRNAQTIHPLSSFHLFLGENTGKKGEKGEGERKRDILSELSVGEKQLGEFMVSKEMRELCPVKGEGMFSVANCMNHSCSPNVMSSSSFDDHRVCFVAIREIEEGEELTIAYVDENLPFNERQKKLRELYHFTCTCLLCTSQSKK